MFRIIVFKDDVIQTKNSEDQALLIYGAQSHIIVAKGGSQKLVLCHLEKCLSKLFLSNEFGDAKFLYGFLFDGISTNR